MTGSTGKANIGHEAESQIEGLQVCSDFLSTNYGQSAASIYPLRLYEGKRL